MRNRITSVSGQELDQAAGSPACVRWWCTGPIATLIPRAVWPGKPILDSGYEFSQNYYELPSTVYTSSAITPTGDLYLHGGWIPVIAGMFLLGCGVRFLDDIIDVSSRPHSTYLFILLFPILVKQEDSWTETLASIPGILLIWIFATYLTFGRKRGRLRKVVAGRTRTTLRNPRRSRRSLRCAGSHHVITKIGSPASAKFDAGVNPDGSAV